MRATVAATSAVVAAVVSMALFLVFDKSQPGKKAILPVLWTCLLLSTAPRINQMCHLFLQLIGSK